jgi:ABC-type transport system involved in cytochrome c biogenesis permease subunit
LSFVLLQIAFVGYLAATAAALVSLAFGWRRPRVLVYLFGVAGWLSHTVGLGTRWYDAGLVELAAAQKTAGRVFEGWERFSTLLSHPPFTNIFESLVFFSWSMALVALVLAVIWRGRRFFVLLLSAMVLCDLTMGLASLQLNQTITPLVPALQSWWLHVHVVTAFLAYACFFISAIAAILFLVRDGVKSRIFGQSGAVVGVLAIFALAGGFPWPGSKSVNVPVLHQAGMCRVAQQCQGTLGSYQCLQGWCVSAEACDAHNPCPAEHSCRDDRCVLSRVDRLIGPQGENVSIPLAATTLAVMTLLLWFLVLGVLYGVLGRSPDTESSKKWTARLNRLMVTGWLLWLGVGLLAWLEGSAQDAKAFAGPEAIDAFVGLRSVPYQFALWIFAGLMMGLCCAILLWPDRINSGIPEKDMLDRMVYRSIQVGFPLMTLTIVTGAVWANYAWGRPWGWDPKETWSLISWIVYAVYLHARLVHGWKGRRAAFIAIIGFLVVVFTFLGVNLGLSGGGLHTYGGSFIGG